MAADDTRDEDLWNDDTPDDDPVTRRAEQGPGGRRASSAHEGSGRGRAGRLLGAAVVAALLVACGVLGYLVWQDHREDELRRTAADDASRLVVQLASYDHTDVDANLDAVTAEATPEFAERYREVSDGLRELLSSGEGTSVGTVPHSAVESVDPESAVVLVFLDQEISNVTVPEGRVDTSRMIVTLVRDGNRWLLDSAELA
ncbi:hypothetical protein [Dietzia sp. PP-33]|jgi:Mce-associated membrane protein|uniref:hypothetical protein n=1 Tax=Dietzia sp. PP-33 TaxID=2957500 RepID=UPI0029A298A1|nr:hypothetical protein [Dietzia sp. PP-33]MDX2357481.1 hypothetical protein [Dietzia sp. PP-33]